MDELVLSVSEFVAVFNQTLNYAYPNITIEGELDNFRISKQKWVYFNLKDEDSSVQFFGNIYQLPGPLEDGLTLKVKGVPTLHPRYGFSINILAIQPTGEGSLKRAARLLEAKLKAEGLFEPSRKRPIGYPVNQIGLITSAEAAAYHDFIKILNNRWGGAIIHFFDVQVQGELAANQIIEALNYFNTTDLELDALVITRGGGSSEDLLTFNTEAVTRAVAASRIPTIVAVGHEIDVSLAELAADRRASTPSQAAELLTPDKKQVLGQLEQLKKQLAKDITDHVSLVTSQLADQVAKLDSAWQDYLAGLKDNLMRNLQLLKLLSPLSALKRGYAIVRKGGQVISSGKLIKQSDLIDIQLHDANITSLVKTIKTQKA